MATYETVLDALGDPTRRRIVDALRRGPASVADVAAVLPVSRPAVSQHLRVLRDCGLVDFESAGTRNLYRLKPDGLAELQAWLDGFWGAALDSFERHARDKAAKSKARKGKR